MHLLAVRWPEAGFKTEDRAQTLPLTWCRRGVAGYGTDDSHLARRRAAWWRWPGLHLHRLHQPRLPLALPVVAVLAGAGEAGGALQGRPLGICAAAAGRAGAGAAAALVPGLCHCDATCACAVVAAAEQWSCIWACMVPHTYGRVWLTQPFSELQISQVHSDLTGALASSSCAQWCAVSMWHYSAWSRTVTLRLLLDLL